MKILNAKGEPLRCVAIIPDGCRSAVRAKGLPDTEGHRLGQLNIRHIVEHLFRDFEVEAVAVWAASDKNLDPVQGRKESEQTNLFKLFHAEMQYRMENLGRDEVRFQLRGNWDRSPYAIGKRKLASMAKWLEKRTAQYPRLLMLLFGYDGETEWEEAARAVVAEGLPLTRENIHAKSWTKDLPPVDLVIRTGVRGHNDEYRPYGDLHTSDLFLPLKSKDAAFHPTEVRWPDFDLECLKLAVKDWQTREMRKGA